MADSVKVTSSSTIQCNGTVYSIGSIYDPGTFTMSSNEIRFFRTSVADETITTIQPASQASFRILVPSVSGVFTWLGTTTLSTSSLYVEAGFPLVLCKTVPYNADLSTRADGTVENIALVNFYQDSGATAYVDCFVAI